MAIRSKNEPLRLFFVRLGTAALIAVIVVVALGVWHIYRKDRESQVLRAQSELQRDALATQDAKLAADTAKLKTERGQEEALRQQYDVGAHGEGLIVIVDPEKPVPIPATTTLMQKLKKAFIFW